ncbi:MAG: hypothetical protein M1812_006556 [Candelaria pacifica]|nr:MAG: hypothetical protein M1812_006556 [Candelaria pacifica]
MGASQSSQLGEDSGLDSSSSQSVPQHLRLSWIIPFLEFLTSTASDRKGYEDDYLRIFRMMKNIFRFCDKKMLILDTVPNHDGSNLTQSLAGTEDFRVFQYAFVWFKRWLTFLHKAKIDDDERAELGYLTARAKQLMDYEKGAYPADPILGYHTMTEDSRLFLELFRAFAEAVNRLRNGEDEGLDANSQLMKELMLNEDLFEEKLSKTHVEDCILYKRVTVDQLNATGPGSIEDIYTINKLERDSFIFRQLRQHGFKRPWKRLHLVKDDQAIVQAATIERINTLLNMQRPSVVLDIRPIGLSLIAQDTCIVCFSEYEDGELVIEQHCGHKAHQECIFEWFDSESRYSFPCPLCRNDPGPLSYKIYRANEDGERTSLIPNDNSPGFETVDVRNERSYMLWLSFLLGHPIFLERQDEFRIRSQVPQELRVRALRHRELLIKRYRDEDEAYQRGLADGRLQALILPNGERRMPPEPRLTRRPDPGIRLMIPIEEDGQPHYFVEAHLKVEAYRWLRRRPEAAFQALVQNKTPVGMPSAYFAIWSNHEQWNTTEEEHQVKTWLRRPRNHSIAFRLLRNPKKNPGMDIGMYIVYIDMINRHLRDELEENNKVRAFLLARPELAISKYPLEFTEAIPEHLWLAYKRLAVDQRDLQVEAIQWYAERDTKIHPNWRDQRGRIVVRGMPTRLLRAWRNVAGDFPLVHGWSAAFSLAPMGQHNPLVQAELPTRDELAGLRNLDSIPLTEWYESRPNTVPGNFDPALFICYKVLRDKSFGVESQVNLPRLTPQQIAKLETKEEQEVLHWLGNRPDLEFWMYDHRDNIPKDLEPALLRAFQRVCDKERVLCMLISRTWIRLRIRELQQLSLQHTQSAQPRPSQEDRFMVPYKIAASVQRLNHMRPTEQRLPEEQEFIDEWQIWDDIRKTPELKFGEDITVPPGGLSARDRGRYLRLIEPLSEEQQAIVHQFFKHAALSWLRDNGEVESFLKNLQEKPANMPSQLYQAAYFCMTNNESGSPVSSESSGESDETEILDLGDSDPYMGVPEEEIITRTLMLLAQSEQGNGGSILFPASDSGVPVRIYQHICMANLIEIAFAHVHNSPGILDTLLNNRQPAEFVDLNGHGLGPLMPYLSRIFAPDHDHDEANLADFQPTVLAHWLREEYEGFRFAFRNNMMQQVRTGIMPEPLPEGMLRRTWYGARRAFFKEFALFTHENRASEFVRTHDEAAEIERMYLAFPNLQPLQLDLPTWRAYKRYRLRLSREEDPSVPSAPSAPNTPGVVGNDMDMERPSTTAVTSPQQMAHQGRISVQLILQTLGPIGDEELVPLPSDLSGTFEPMSPRTEIISGMDMDYDPEDDTIDLSRLSSEEGHNRFVNEFARRYRQRLALQHLYSSQIANDQQEERLADTHLNPHPQVQSQSRTGNNAYQAVLNPIAEETAREQAAERVDYMPRNSNNDNDTDDMDDDRPHFSPPLDGFNDANSDDNTEDELDAPLLFNSSAEQRQADWLRYERGLRIMRRELGLERVPSWEDTDEEIEEGDDVVTLQNAVVKWARKTRAGRVSKENEQKHETGSHRRSSGRVEKKRYNKPTTFLKKDTISSTNSNSNTKAKSSKMSASNSIPSNPTSSSAPQTTTSPNDDNKTNNTTTPTTESPTPTKTKPHTKHHRNLIPPPPHQISHPPPTLSDLYYPRKRKLTRADYDYLYYQERRRILFPHSSTNTQKNKNNEEGQTNNKSAEEEAEYKKLFEMTEAEEKEIDKIIEDEEREDMFRRWEVVDREERERENRIKERRVRREEKGQEGKKKEGKS